MEWSSSRAGGWSEGEETGDGAGGLSCREGRDQLSYGALIDLRSLRSRAWLAWSTFTLTSS
jgi:hypothetical protein